MVDYRLMWGHEMIPMQVEGLSECKNCGAHFTDSVCPSSATCECMSSRQQVGFTLAGVMGIPVFVCGGCGLPTEPMLRAVLEACRVEV